MRPNLAISVSPALGFCIWVIYVILELQFFYCVAAMTPAKNRINDPDIKINPEAVASIHEGGVVILDNSKGRLYSSGPAGAYIWRCIEQQFSVESIAEKLHTDFQAELTTAREHTARFIEQLHANGLIERRAA